MAHGYLGDGYGKYGDRDPDGGRYDERSRDQRGDWRGEQRGDWRERNRQDDVRGGSRDQGGWQDRDRGFMFDRSRGSAWQGNRDESQGDRYSGSDRGGQDDWNRSGQRGGGEDRGFLSRTANEVRDWFDDDEHDYRGGNRGQSGGGNVGRGFGGGPWGDQQGGRNRMSSHQDDHYLSWRQQQMDALDRDYQDYCRERQQQFHEDFGTWRRNRQSGSNNQQQQQQMSPGLESSANHSMDGTAGTNTDARIEPQSTVEPDSGATLGTTNSENSYTGTSRS